MGDALVDERDRNFLGDLVCRMRRATAGPTVDADLGTHPCRVWRLRTTISSGGGGLALNDQILS